MMGSFFIVISILAFMLTVSIICYVKLNEAYSKLEEELTKITNMYHDLLYDNCVLADKIEKIKNLNLIDYNNNDYYKELLTVNK